MVYISSPSKDIHTFSTHILQRLDSGVKQKEFVPAGHTAEGLLLQIELILANVVQDSGVQHIGQVAASGQSLAYFRAANVN